MPKRRRSKDIMRRMPISGATRHDMTVGIPGKSKQSVGANEAFKFHKRKPGEDFQRFGLVEEVEDNTVTSALYNPRHIIFDEFDDFGSFKRQTPPAPWTFDGVAVTTYNPARNESSRLGNPSLVVALAGPVTLHMEYKVREKGTAIDSRFEDVRDAVGDRGVVLRSTKNSSNGVDVILYDSFKAFNL